MKEGEPKPEPTIIDILNEDIRKGTDLEEYPTVELLAERSGIPTDTLYWWLENDKEFQDKLRLVKETLDKDPNRDNPTTKIKLNTAVLSFGIIIVLDETKKRYTV
jgi:hypothetical protein